VRVYDPLFTCNNPDSHPDGFLSVVNPDSEQDFSDAMVEVGLQEIIRRAPWPNFKGEQKEDSTTTPPESVRFQGTRVGYFCLDRDSSDDAIVLNRTVTLKEDPKK
jgi:glutaminyl-tRNA synthetase